ncbi:MAG: 3-deoxy-D-manno-octulosonic acid transferase [Gammaproteobacteria bacterium]|nr:3-deoxy-D-manno-octulosonic acid transferase [Gammaproteobacteria bacterium]
MMRWLYRLLATMALPVATALFVLRIFRDDPSEQREFSQRFGFGARHATDAIWIHAVSVGEVQAAAALVRALRSKYPDVPITLTATTGTGVERARETLGRMIDIRFLPFDSLGCVKRFLDRVRPRLAIIIEKELWPNLLGECAARAIPVVLASATISARSVNLWRRFAPLFRNVFESSVIVAAQSETDADRFRQIGVTPNRIQVIGNLKFDLSFSHSLVEQGTALRTRYGWPHRTILVGGSTYEFEEFALLEVQRRLRVDGVDIALVIAPRHPSRFDAVAARLHSAGINFVRRSQLDTGSTSAAPDVLLLDTLGELMTAYATADLAFVGGSLLTDMGGHNLIEPAALAVPTITGSQGYNAPDITVALQAAGALTVVNDVEGLFDEVRGLVARKTERTRRGALGRAFVEKNRGTLERLLVCLEPLMAVPRHQSLTTNC